MNTLEVSQLAADRGCILKILHIDDSDLYWVENHVFIGKPFDRLDDLVQFIRLLPVLGRRD
ncbi:hypothetical protein C7B76_05735 [filamentous cyanobacterium CCP2]|nr:hypothetical protein C7B76_05735 [filamentous cyanobacterium CCP2]